VVLVAIAAAACTTPPRAYRPAVDAWAQTPIVDAESAPLEPGADASLADLVAWAEHRSPALRAAASRWKAALDRVPQAGSLPDPVLTFGYFLEETQTRTGPMQWRVGLSQPLPWLGELDHADEAALASALVAAARFDAERLGLGARIRDAWAELAWVEEAVDVTRAHHELLLRWEEVARARYATGLGSEADVIRAQVELGTLVDRLQGLEDLRLPVAARLNAALDRPAGAALPTPTLDGQAPAAYSADDLRANLPSSSPELAALDHSIDAAAARVALARTDGYPDAALGVDFTRIGKGGDDALALTAGISLPIQRGRIRAGIAQAEAELNATRADRHEAANRLSAELELLLYRERDAQRRVRLYRDSLLPKAEEAVAAVMVAYQTDEADFLDLVDAERVLLEFQLATARARADRSQALAAIVALTGRSLHEETTP
jgi:cobalt-zinc-cadmium efflux system outer membrane protein